MSGAKLNARQKKSRRGVSFSLSQTLIFAMSWPTVPLKFNVGNRIVTVPLMPRGERHHNLWRSCSRPVEPLLLSPQTFMLP